jgi:signal transduction histidine kinase
MHSHVAAPAGFDRRIGFCRRALSGLTPQVVGILAALLFARALATTLSYDSPIVRQYDLGGWLHHLLRDYGELLIQGAPMVVIIIGAANLGPHRGPGRLAALTAAVVLSAFVGALARIIFWAPWGLLVYVWPRYAVLGGLLTVVGELYRREVASNEAAQQAEIDRVALEREMTEARLQALQAQIEPHFLFNTLANARRLYDEDHALGRAMLESLIRYLEIALPRMRQGESTLERDVELIEAFLHIQQIRMGRRLAFSIDVPPRLRAHPMPPMMLLTLVENAIKHGLNPSPGGGLIRVTARANSDALSMTVADTGIGFASASGPGIGLANISARLAAQFGDRASLTLENNELGGATATIVLPLTDSEAMDQCADASDAIFDANPGSAARAAAMALQR